MFKIEVYGLWSRDFMPSLSRVVATFLKIEPEQAKEEIYKALEKGVLRLESQNMGEALNLVEGLMEFGAYVNVEQTGPISETGFQNDIVEALAPELTGWFIKLDKEEKHVEKIIDPTQLAKIRFVNQTVNDRVGEEMMWRGASPINQQIEEDLEVRMKEWRTAWGKRIRAAIARKIALKKKESPNKP